MEHRAVPRSSRHDERRLRDGHQERTRACPTSAGFEAARSGEARLSRWKVCTVARTAREASVKGAASGDSGGQERTAAHSRAVSGRTRWVRELIPDAAAVDANRARFRNPFIPLIRFSIATGLFVIAAHDRVISGRQNRSGRRPGFPRSVINRQGLTPRQCSLIRA